MLPELLRFSSRSNLLQSIPEHLKNVHFTENGFNHAAAMAVETNKNVSHTTTNIIDTSEWLEEKDFGDEDLATLGL